MERDKDTIAQQISVLRRYAQTLAANREDAEDLVQDALLRAYEQRGSLRKATSLRSWLMSILHNTFITEWRRRQSPARQTILIEDFRDIAVSASQEHVVRLNQIHTAFSRLPEEQRAVMHLVAIEGMAYQEAATVLEIPIGTLMSRLGRARAALREFEESTKATPPSDNANRIKHLKIIGGSDERK